MGGAKPDSKWRVKTAGVPQRPAASPTIGRRASTAYRADDDAGSCADGAGDSIHRVAATPITPMSRGIRINGLRPADAANPFRSPALGGACFGASFASVGYFAVIQSANPPSSALARNPWRISVATTRALTSSSGSES